MCAVQHPRRTGPVGVFQSLVGPDLTPCTAPCSPARLRRGPPGVPDGERPSRAMLHRTMPRPDRPLFCSSVSDRLRRGLYGVTRPLGLVSTNLRPSPRPTRPYPRQASCQPVHQLVLTLVRPRARRGDSFLGTSEPLATPSQGIGTVFW